MESALINIAIVVGVGLILFFAVGQVIDGLVFRFAVGPGDPITNILANAPNPRRRFVLNILRPVMLTLIIFGGGLLTIGILRTEGGGAVGAACWFLFLTWIACLAGRRASRNEARWAMVITSILLTGAFIALRSGA